MNEKQIEVEFIGEINKDKFLELKALFEREGKFKKIKKRLSFMYFRNKIPKDLTEIKDELVDLRFRITNKEPEIILKYGSFSGSHARKEISLGIKNEEIQKYLELFVLLDWHIGVVYATKTFVYEYKGIEFSLVEINDYGYNFEAEILTSEDGVENAKKDIITELDALKIKPFDGKGLDKQCNAINNKKELQFDLSKQSFDEIKNNFKEFF